MNDHAAYRRSLPRLPPRAAQIAKRWFAGMTFTALAGCLIGCATDQPSHTGAVKRGGTSSALATPALDPDEPAVINRIGVEVRSWVINEREDDIARALRSVESAQPERVGVSEEAWKRAGMRVLRVNRADLPRLQAELSPRVGQFSLDKFEPGQRVSSAPIAVQRQWLEQGARWSVAARGPEFARGGVIGLSDTRVALPPGTLRLLARCWPVPVPGDSGVDAEMRIQLVPQHADGRLETPDLLAPRTTTTDATNEGLVFRRLLLTLTLRAGEAVLIVPESPGRSWQDQTSTFTTTDTAIPAATNASAEPGSAALDSALGQARPILDESTTAPIAKLGKVRRDPPTPQSETTPKPAEPTRPGASTRGPDDGPVRSLGEEMLSARGVAGGARVLIALVPELGRSQRSSDSRPPAGGAASPGTPALTPPRSPAPPAPPAPVDATSPPPTRELP